MKNGDFVKINYVGRIKETNEVFDLTDEDVAKKEKIHTPEMNYGPITLIMGEKMILPAVEDEIKNLTPGENKKFEIAPEKAFGPRDTRLIKVFNEAEFRKNDMNPIPGLTVNVNGLRGKVLSSSGGRVSVDFNHPLAGKTLVYDLTFLETVENDVDKIKSIVQFYTGVKTDGIKVSINGPQAIINLPSKNTINHEAKDKISTETMKWAKGVESVKFEEIFDKKTDKKQV